MWQLLATPAASLVAGVVAVILLIALQRHRDRDGHTVTGYIVASFLLGISVYTLTVTVFGHFFLHSSLATTITTCFGENRVAWLFVGLMADTFARLYRYYDP
jgi:hypothetical protein